MNVGNPNLSASAPVSPLRARIEHHAARSRRYIDWRGRDYVFHNQLYAGRKPGETRFVREAAGCATPDGDKRKVCQ